jgi:putative oxidoreductase
MKYLHKIHEIIHKLDNKDAAMLFVRIAVGVVFINAGWMKINNIDFVVQGFASMGLPAFMAYFVTYAEFIGGIAVLIGIFVRYFGVILAIIMLVATFKAHWAQGFSLANGGYEYTFVLFFLSLSLIATGAGKYSVAKLLPKRKVDGVVSNF